MQDRYGSNKQKNLVDFGYVIVKMLQVKSIPDNTAAPFIWFDAARKKLRFSWNFVRSSTDVYSRVTTEQLRGYLLIVAEECRSK